MLPWLLYLKNELEKVIEKGTDPELEAYKEELKRVMELINDISYKR